jgi:hypothetical protein
MARQKSFDIGISGKIAQKTEKDFLSRVKTPDNQWLGACGVEEKTKPLPSDWEHLRLSRKKEHGKKTKAMDI